MTSMKYTVRGIQPVFIDKETNQPLKDIWLYAFRHSDSGEKLISVHRTDSKGRIKRRLFVPYDKFDYYFFVASFELGKTITEKSADRKTKLNDKFLGDEQLQERAHNIVTTETNLSEQNSILTWVKKDMGQKIAVSFSSAVHKALYRFKTSDRPGAWTKLDKQTIVDGMSERIKNPYEVNQKEASLCGPTAILFTLIFKESIKYITTMQELYETGVLKRGGEILKPDPETFPGPVPRGLYTPQADWMLAATIRESENVWAEADSQFGGATMPGLIQKWGKTIIGRESAAAICDPLLLTGDVVRISLPAFQEKIKSGYFAITAVDGDIVKGTPIVNMPTHWITITKIDFDVKENIFTIRCHSWGHKYKITKTLDQLADTIFNYVMIG